MGKRKKDPIFKKSLLFAVINTAQRPGKMFLNSPADFPPVLKLLFQQIFPAQLQEKQEGDSCVVFPLVDVLTQIYVLRTRVQSL